MALRIATTSLLVCLHFAAANWTVGEWATCSAHCGNGSRTREVRCPHAMECDVQVKPLTSTWCRGTQCPWDVTRVSGWGNCSNGCGEGVQLSMPACNCPMPCQLPDDAECKDTPLPPSSSWLSRRCFGTLASRPDEYCTNCTARGDSCLACSPGFKLVGGKCEIASRVLRQTVSLKANAQMLSPMSRAVALASALEQAFRDFTNSSASVVSMESRLAEANQRSDFLAVRRLGGAVCKKARVVSHGGEYNRARFFLDGKNITSQTEPRGFGIVTIDPDTLEVSGPPVSFDTYGDADSVARLTKYLNGLRDGTIVLIGLSDSGLERLDAGALAAFHRLGAAVQGFGMGNGYRQPYAFIGQVGSPSIKELWDVPQGSTVEIEGALPCIEPSILSATLVAPAGNNTDAALSNSAKSFGSVRPEDIMKHASARLRASGVDLPDGATVEMGELKGICPDHLVWASDKCMSPRPGTGAGGFPLWAKILLGVLGALLLLCCLGALCLCCCRRKRREDSEERLVAAEPDSRVLAAAAPAALEAERHGRGLPLPVPPAAEAGRNSRALPTPAPAAAEGERHVRGLPLPTPAAAEAERHVRGLPLPAPPASETGRNSRALQAPTPAAAGAVAVLDGSCKHCGNVYLDDAVFCRKCGHRRGASEAAGGAAPELKRAFALIDRDGSGALSRIEVIKACRESEEVRRLLGLPQVIREEDGTRDAFEAVFQRLDKDNSKSITYEEFVRAFSKDSAHSAANPRGLAGCGMIEDGRKSA